MQLQSDPTLNKIFISFKNQKESNTNWKYKITDLFGRIIQESVLSHKMIEMDGLPFGMYQLQIFNEENFYTTKIILAK